MQNEGSLNRSPSRSLRRFWDTVIEELASRGVNHGTRGDIPGGPHTYQSRTRLRHWVVAELSQDRSNPMESFARNQARDGLSGRSSCTVARLGSRPTTTADPWQSIWAVRRKSSSMIGSRLEGRTHNRLHGKRSPLRTRTDPPKGYSPVPDMDVRAAAGSRIYLW